MKTSLDHLLEKKQKELRLLTEYVKSVFEPQAVILFGSYARGDWVDIEREYQSDYDILVACGRKKKKNYDLREELEKRIYIDDDIATKVSFTYEPMSVINAEIRKYNYLFIDIRREGILLYSESDSFQLEDIKDLEPKERYEKAVRDIKYWFQQFDDFYKGYQFYYKENTRNLAAFHLHQTAEHLYISLLLVYTGYKPKTHDLEELEKLVIPFYKDISQVFPRNTEPQKQLYNLLRKAYVDARYDMNYTITKRELKALETLIKKFRVLAIDLYERKLKELEKLARQ